MNQAKKDNGESIYKRLCAALREEDPALDSICAAQALAVTLAKSFGLTKELFVQATADSWDLGDAPSNVDIH